MFYHILLICVLAYIGYHDAKTMEIDNSSVFGVICISLYMICKGYISVQYALLNAVFTIGMIVFIYMLLHGIHMPMIGAGDQKLLIALSACVGVDVVYAVLFITLLLQSTYLLIIKTLRKRAIYGDMSLPMGPFICIAYIIYEIGELLL